MSEWVLTGRVVDLILLLVAVEAVALQLHHRLTGKGVSLSAVLPNLLAGAALLLALRAALTQAGWVWIALSLALALMAHVADLRQRWLS